MQDTLFIKNKTWKVRQKPALKYWCCLTAINGFASHAEQRDWELVLSARNIHYSLHKMRNHHGGVIEHIFVPVLLENLARVELNAFNIENGLGAQKKPLFPTYRNYWLAPIFLLPFLLWHGMRVGWWPCPDILPSPKLWQDIGILDPFQIIFHSQWYRLVTAISLHADLSHLSGNIVFGAIFLLFLARLVGPARAAWLSMFGGILGNSSLIFFRQKALTSLGFSTAVFASIGVLSGIMVILETERKKMFLPLATAAGMLAILGTEGEKTDYGAHIAGLCAGMLLGFATGYRISKNLPLIPGILAAMLYFILPILAWCLAFGKIS